MNIETVASVGPARVLEVEGTRLYLESCERRFWARSALGPTLPLNPGDEVLVVGESECFVIGVLSLSRASEAPPAADLRLSSAGRVEIKAGREIVLESRRVTIRAEKIEFTAKTLLERFVNHYHWIKDSVLTRAGRMRTSVDGHYVVRAERIMESAQGDVKINGTKIHLG